MTISPGGNAAAASRAPSPKSGHIRSLDGLRAISILLVMSAHLLGPIGAGDLGHFGVVVFFVISGFLITGLLISEHERTGGVSLKLFYARRALRIFPASYAYIGFAAALSAVGLVQLHRADIWNAVTYTVNYSASRSWTIGHLWSLSVEEQFYLLWPFTFRSLGPRRAAWVAGAVIILGPVARAGAWVFLRHTPYGTLEMFPMVADSLATGCVLAALRGWLETQSWYLRLFRPGWSLLILAVVLGLNRLMGYTVVSVLGMALINIGLGVLIHRSVYCWGDGMGRFLNWRPVAFVGLLSYSLYLWQQLFLDRHTHTWRTAFPQNILLATGAALLSYFLLERPLMKLRGRLRA